MKIDWQEAEYVHWEVWDKALWDDAQTDNAGHPRLELVGKIILGSVLGWLLGDLVRLLGMIR